MAFCPILIPHWRRSQFVLLEFRKRFVPLRLHLVLSEVGVDGKFSFAERVLLRVAALPNGDLCLYIGNVAALTTDDSYSLYERDRMIETPKSDGVFTMDENRCMWHASWDRFHHIVGMAAGCSILELASQGMRWSNLLDMPFIYCKCAPNSCAF